MMHEMLFYDLDLILTSYDVQNAFSVHRSSKKLDFENLHWVKFSDLELILTSHDSQNAFSMHGSFV